MSKNKTNTEPNNKQAENFDYFKREVHLSLTICTLHHFRNVAPCWVFAQCSFKPCHFFIDDRKQTIMRIQSEVKRCLSCAAWLANLVCHSEFGNTLMLSSRLSRPTGQVTSTLTSLCPSEDDRFDIKFFFVSFTNTFFVAESFILWLKRKEERTVATTYIDTPTLCISMSRGRGT